MDLANFKAWYDAHKEEILSEYFRFLKFESIGTDPAFDKQTKECADYLVEFLKKTGMDVSLWDTPGQPIVFAEKKCSVPDAPTLLVYHHYDVQPVDPLELWESPPFEPAIRDGHVFARGANDNKGQCAYSLFAIRAFLEACPNPNFHLKIFVEGEEESGSAGTLAALAGRRKELQSDYLLIVDSGLIEADQPGITLGMRGIITLEVQVRVADVDMHSGGYGGIAHNPLRVLTKMLASLWNDAGKVAVDGFYDAVKAYTDEELSQLNVELNKERIIREMGLRGTCPEPGFTIGQSVGLRPTVEINGLSGGYTGEGFKTVIPAVASAKVSARLVSHQNAKEIAEKLVAHLKAHVPKEVEVDVVVDQTAEPFVSESDSPIAKMASIAYEEVMGKPCQKFMGGGSVPVTGPLAEVSGAQPLAIGYWLDSDHVHSPNENFGLDRFEKGFLTIGRILSLLNENS